MSIRPLGDCLEEEVGKTVPLARAGLGRPLGHALPEALSAERAQRLGDGADAVLVLRALQHLRYASKQGRPFHLRGSAAGELLNQCVDHTFSFVGLVGPHHRQGPCDHPRCPARHKDPGDGRAGPSQPHARPRAGPRWDRASRAGLSPGRDCHAPIGPSPQTLAQSRAGCRAIEPRCPGQMHLTLIRSCVTGYNTGSEIKV